MEKEKLSEQLKADVGTTSMSDKSWADYVNNVFTPFIPDDESKQADYILKHAAYLKSQSGQYNKDIADKVNIAKKDWESKQRSPEPQIPVDKPDSKDEPNKPEWAISLEKKFSQLELEKADAEKAAKYKQLLSNVSSKVKDLGAANDELLDLVIGSTQLDDNLSEDDCIKLVKEKYDQKYSKLYGEGVRPAYGSAAYIGNSKADRDSYKKHLEETGRLKKTQN